MSHIEKLDNFFDNISEMIKNPLDIKWFDNGDKLRGLFNINGHVYQIMCSNTGNNIWKYDFYLYDTDEFSPELTDFKKDIFRVLPTVEVGMSYLYNNKKVDAIVFGSSDKSKGRKKIYEAFCHKFSKDNNIKYYTKIYYDDVNDITRQIFILYDGNINMDILTKNVFIILKDEKFG